MPWPTSQDYNEAVQNLQTSVHDEELRQGQVVCNALGIPQPCSGNFADVYAVECPATATKWAAKCFTREVHGLRERYSEISNHLRQAHLPFTVDFQYLEQGIRVAGRWYPILKMHWVEGFTLNTFVRDSLDKPATLEALGRIWLRMAGRLRGASIAHGDLQHGNILLVPDPATQSLAVKLIDYDGMWVPALAGIPSGEVGHPSYQHPQRLRESTYGPEVDRFSLLVIHCALRALAEGGRQLWERYDNGDNLLFRQQDFEAPGRSPLFAELLRMNHPEIRQLAAKLIDATHMPLDQTPLLEELFPNAAKPRPSAVARGKSQETTATVEKVASSFEEVAESHSGTDASVKGRGLLMGALIGAAVFGLACLGLGTLLFTAAGGKPAASNLAAKGKASSEMVREIQPETKPKRQVLDRGDTRVDKTASDSRKGLALNPPKRTEGEPVPKPPERVPETESDDAGRHGEHEIENSIHMKLDLIPTGSFQMGSPPEEKDRVGNEGPRHTVEISRPFYMGVYPVTQDEYQQVVGINPSYFSPSGGGKDKVAGLDTRRFPVEQVSWYEAVAFCEKLSGLEREKKAGRVYRLPTEAEWEYACRAGTTTRFFFGERLSAKNANFDATQPYGGVNKKVSYGGREKGPTLGRTTAVGSYPKNAFGLYDMHGNVYQWCNDWHDEDYFKRSQKKDPQGPAKGPYGERSMRGGTWSEPAWNCRVTSRSRLLPDIRGNWIGFRVVCVVRGIP